MVHNIETLDSTLHHNYNRRLPMNDQKHIRHKNGCKVANIWGELIAKPIERFESEEIRGKPFKVEWNNTQYIIMFIPSNNVLWYPSCFLKINTGSIQRRRSSARKKLSVLTPKQASIVYFFYFTKILMDTKTYNLISDSDIYNKY